MSLSLGDIALPPLSTSLPHYNAFRWTKKQHCFKSFVHGENGELTMYNFL